MRYKKEDKKCKNQFFVTILIFKKVKTLKNIINADYLKKGKLIKVYL